MDEVMAALKKAQWSLVSVQSREQQRRPLAPFITSQLQRDASSKLGFNVRRTMGVAQRLYEGIDVGAEGTVGLITYMRTDSPRVAPEAIAGAREWIGKQLGAQYLPATPNVYKGKKDAQDAHEAIRPDRCFADAGVDCALSDRGTVEALPADLAAVCGFADDAGGL